MAGCFSLKCIGSSKGPQPVRDLQCVDTTNETVKLTFNPGSARWPSKWQAFHVLIVGGPSSDLRGPREQVIPSPGGAGRITCDIEGLIPSTEYTITISAATKAGKRSEGVSLEVRTADRQGHVLGKDDFSCKTGSADPKAANQKEKKNRQAPAAGIVQVNLRSEEPAPRQPDREDDTSTVAPSERDDQMNRDSSLSDDEAAPDAGACPVTRVVPREDVPVLSSSCPAAPPEPQTRVLPEEENRPTPECKLCSILDCLKPKSATPAPADFVVLEVCESPRDPPTASAASSQVRSMDQSTTATNNLQGNNQRTFRPNRPPFPGRPISYEPINQ